MKTFDQSDERLAIAWQCKDEPLAVLTERLGVSERYALYYREMVTTGVLERPPLTDDDWHGLKARLDAGEALRPLSIALGRTPEQMRNWMQTHAPKLTTNLTAISNETGKPRAMSLPLHRLAEALG